MEKIIASACKMKENGFIVFLPKPARHMDLAYIGECGFITSDGRFLDRKEAKIFAKEIMGMTEFVESGDLDELHSEDLY